MKPPRSLYFLLVILSVSLLSYGQVSTADITMAYKIKQEGQKHSDIDTLSYIMTDLAGPRLTGSPGLDRANAIAEARLEKYGLSKVRIEEAIEFTRGGWDYTKAYAAMTAPYYVNFAVTPVAWTAGTNGPVKGEVILVDIRKEEDFDKYRGKLQGKIVITPSSSEYQVNYEPVASRYDDEKLAELAKAPGMNRRPAGREFTDWRAMYELREKIQAFLDSEGVAMILNRGRAFNIPSSTGARYDGKATPPVTQINIPQEAYGRMERLLKNGEKVEMEAEINCQFTPDRKVYNVIAEIPGTDPKIKDQVVLLGAHIDSWHGGTGAADNASGCIVMMEAIRILKTLDIKPRRTIRIALWGGEEQGLYGSRGYVNKYLFDTEERKPKADYDRFSVYFNMDNGTGRYRGIYLQENDMVRSLFEAWMKPFEDMGFSTIAIRNTGGTDHLSFDGAGLPGFQFIQDEIEYSRGYHTNTDTRERLLTDDLRFNAIFTAWMAYKAAMNDEMIPRKPAMNNKQQGPPGGF